MARMRIEIDQELLARAGELLGTTNRKDIVDTALRAFIAHRQADEAYRRRREQQRADALDEAGAQQRRAAAWERMMADSRAGMYNDAIAYRRHVKSWQPSNT